MDFDVIVIGGGAAGLAGAITLARSRRTVLVLDAGEPRNAPAHAVHAYLARDGVSPLDLLAQGRAELASYGGTVRQATAESAAAVDGGFEVRWDDGRTLSARRLLVATGLVDELPEMPGLREHWGGDVVHCPYCHGWEVRDRSIAVLATGPMAGHQALLFSQLSDDVTLLLNDQTLPEEEAAMLSAIGVTSVPGTVTRVLSEAGRITGVEVAGSVLPCTTVVVGPRMVARSAVLASLGVEPVEMKVGDAVIATHIPSDPLTGLTSVPGVYVAGNITDPMAQVIAAAAAGTKAGAVINADLIRTDAMLAVGAGR